MTRPHDWGIVADHWFAPWRCTRCGTEVTYHVDKQQAGSCGGWAARLHAFRQRINAIRNEQRSPAEGACT